MPCCRNYVCREPFVPLPCSPNDGFKSCMSFDFCRCPLLAGTVLDINCQVGPGWHLQDATYIINENSVLAAAVSLGDLDDNDGYFTVPNMADPAALGQLVWGAGIYLTAPADGVRYTANNRLVLITDTDITTGILSLCVRFSILNPPQGPALINSVANVD